MNKINLIITLIKQLITFFDFISNEALKLINKKSDFTLIFDYILIKFLLLYLLKLPVYHA